MIEISIKTLLWFVGGGAGLVAWFIRLEAKVIWNKAESKLKLEAVDLKVSNHIESSKEKSSLIFGKIEGVQKDIGEIKTSVAVIAAHVKGE